MPNNPVPNPAHPPRRRVAGIRRPRATGPDVAGGTGPVEPAAPAGDSAVDVLTPPQEAAPQDVPPAGEAPEEAPGDGGSARHGLVKRPVDLRKDSGDTGDGVAGDGVAGEAGAGEAGARPTGKRRLRKGEGSAAVAPRPRRPVPTAVLAGLLVVLVAAAVFFGVAAAGLRDTPAARNTALTDVGATAQVTQQLTDALKAVYSFDFARLDQNEADARAVITPDFTAQFDLLFGQVRELAPQQQAVVTATVASSAIREIDGDRAVMVVFLDQQATRAQAGTEATQLAAAGRLTVTGELVDGRWKISNVQAQ